MAATTANVAWPIQANSPSIPSFRKSLVPKNDFNVYKSLITQDKGSYINRMYHRVSLLVHVISPPGLEKDQIKKPMK